MSNFGDVRRNKRQKPQQNLTSMFRPGEPKFVEVTGVQLSCPYCNLKFRAPQGLVNHKYMHERRGDKIPKPGRPRILNPLAVAPSPQLSKVPLKVQKPLAPAAVTDPRVQAPLPDAVTAPTVDNSCMTRRFTVQEKLQIIDKHKERDNISATCR